MGLLYPVFLTSYMRGADQFIRLSAKESQDEIIYYVTVLNMKKYKQHILYLHGANVFTAAKAMILQCWFYLIHNLIKFQLVVILYFVMMDWLIFLCSAFQ